MDLQPSETDSDSAGQRRVSKFTIKKVVDELPSTNEVVVSVEVPVTGEATPTRADSSQASSLDQPHRNGAAPHRETQLETTIIADLHPSGSTSHGERDAEKSDTVNQSTKVANSPATKSKRFSLSEVEGTQEQPATAVKNENDASTTPVSGRKRFSVVKINKENGPSGRPYSVASDSSLDRPLSTASVGPVQSLENASSSNRGRVINTHQGDTEPPTLTDTGTSSSIHGLAPGDPEVAKKRSASIGSRFSLAHVEDPVSSTEALDTFNIENESSAITPTDELISSHPHIRFAPNSSPPRSQHLKSRSISSADTLFTSTPISNNEGYEVGTQIKVSDSRSVSPDRFRQLSLPASNSLFYPDILRHQEAADSSGLSIAASNSILYKRLQASRHDAAYVSNPTERKREKKRKEALKKFHQSHHHAHAHTLPNTPVHNNSTASKNIPLMELFNQSIDDRMPPSQTKSSGASSPHNSTTSEHPFYSQSVLSSTSSVFSDTFVEGEEKSWAPNIAMVLFLISVLSSSADWLLEYVVNLISEGRSRLHSEDTLHSYSARFAVWWIYAVVVVFLAIVVTHYLSPLLKNGINQYHSFGEFLRTPRKSAATGGIPELKTILAGSSIIRWLDFRMWCAKFVGMTLALSSGLFIGKEGPFVHMACILGDHVFQFLHRMIGSKTDLSGVRQEILVASAALGVAAAFRSPIGGVLFSVEVTAATYKVSNYSKGFFTAVWGATLVYLFSPEEEGDEEHYRWSLARIAPERTFKKSELLIFIVMGLCCGLLGAGFIAHFTILQKAKGRLVQKMWGAKPPQHQGLITGILLGLFVATFTSIVTFVQGDYMVVGIRKSVSDLWSESLVKTTEGSVVTFEPFADNWNGFDRSQGVNCLLYSISVFVLTTVALALPIVAGMFTPTVAIGAGLGRAMAELVHAIWPELGVSRSGYAMVGAAGFSASVTHTISTAIVVCEITGTIDFVLPILLVVVIGVFVSGRLTSSIFDRICKLNNLPHIYLVRADVSTKVALDILVDETGNNEIPSITTPATLGDIMKLLKEWRWSHDDAIAVVNNSNDGIGRGVLYGEVRLSALIDFVQKEVVDKYFYDNEDLDSNTFPSQSTEHTRQKSSQRTENGTTIRGSLGAKLHAIMLHPNKKERAVLSRIANQIRRLQEDNPEVLEMEVRLEQCGLLSTLCPRMTVDTSAKDVIDYIVMMGIQHVMITDFDGQLQGKVTVRSVNSKLQEWSKREKEERREERSIASLRSRKNRSPGKKSSGPSTLTSVFDRPSPSPVNEVGTMGQTSLLRRWWNRIRQPQSKQYNSSGNAQERTDVSQISDRLGSSSGHSNGMRGNLEESTGISPQEIEAGVTDEDQGRSSVV